jgi:hypothetical protein
MWNAKIPWNEEELADGHKMKSKFVWLNAPAAGLELGGSAGRGTTAVVVPDSC